MTYPFEDRSGSKDSPAAAPVAATGAALHLINGWENYNGTVRAPAWAVDVQGVVHLRGAVDQGGANTSMYFARLPLAARPNEDVWLSTNATDAALARLDLGSDGFMWAECPSSDAEARDFFNLDGITYSPR